MKKKIIFMAFCLILFLIFTALSYGDIHPKYKEHPDQELKSPPIEDQWDDILLLVIPNCNGFSLLVYAKVDFPKENPTSQRSAKQRIQSKANNAKRVR